MNYIASEAIGQPFFFFSQHVTDEPIWTDAAPALRPATQPKAEKKKAANPN
jgi:hypothetical protein